MKNIQRMFNTSKRSVCKTLALLLFIMGFLPYVPASLPVNAEGDYEVIYNPNPAWHYDGVPFEPGQWQGYFIMEGLLFHHENGEMPPITINAWRGATVKTVAIATTNFSIPEVGVKLNTVAFCLRPIAPNWPNDINAYEITPELCNEFTDVSNHQIDERDIDALHIAMETMGLNKDGVNVSNETYAAMRLLTWYVGLIGWNNGDEFMDGIDFLADYFEGGKVNKNKFKQICQKAADNIDRNVGAPETGLTDYMPAFTGRYSSNAPVIAFEDAGNGTYTYEYTYTRKYDSAWEYTCPTGVTVSYGSNSVTFTSSVPEPAGIFTGSVRPGSKLEGIIPVSGILICKSDEPERQDMLIPYDAGKTPLNCFFKAKAGESGGEGMFPELPDVEYLKYEETFEAHYNIAGEKFDAETNQPLSRAEFEVFEKSPSGQPDILDNFWDSGIDTWTDWRRCKRVETDTNGQFNHTDIRTYDYVGTYCGGHDAGQKVIDDYRDYIAACEEENANAEPDPGDPDAEPEPLWDTAAMNDHLADLEAEYQEQIAACEEFSSEAEHHFFHSMEGEDSQKSDMEDDKQDAYDQFVDMEYDYTIREIRTHSGYSIHGEHGDDNPLPVIRTASSESGKTGYVIEPDNKNAGLPADYENAPTTQSAGVNPGTLTRASSWLPINDETAETGSLKQESDLDLQASVSDAEISMQSFFDLKSMGRTLKGIQTSIMKASGSDAEEPTLEETTQEPVEEELIPENLIKEATPSDALFQFGGTAAYAVKSSTMEAFEVASWEPDWQRGSAGATNTGAGGVNLFSWYIYDHRIEGEVHINKRDMELLAGETAGYDSYGDTQGDATLEGAVYGLYAAQDIIHPDGKSGAVFKANDLVSIATTDKKGDASFLTITEISDTSRTLKNNYDGTQIDANNPGVYPNNLAMNGNQWIGRPLILGRYYIKEINRSEGYELSITGVDMAETNRGADGTVIADNGSAHVDNIRAGGGETSGTSGSVIEIKTENANEGVELYLYNYPADSKFGIMRTGTAIRPGQSVTGWDEKETYVAGNGTHVFKNTSGSGNAYYTWILQADGKYIRYETDSATPLYEMHRAGEEKRDAAGNRIPVRDTSGNIVYTTNPEKKTVPYKNHTTTNFQDVVIPAIVTSVRATANELLKEAGYLTLVPPSTKAPWETLILAGTPQEQVETILAWYRDHPFYNAAGVESITDQGNGTFTALIRYDYLTAGAATGTLYGDELYVKEVIPAGNGLYYYVSYLEQTYTLTNGMAELMELQLITEPITTADVIADHIQPQFVPQYETYATDEAVQDASGNPVPVMELVPEISENTSVTDTKTIDYLTDIAEYIPEKNCFKVLIRPERMTDEEKNGWLKIETVHTGLGGTVNGQKLQTGDILKYVLGISATATVPSEDWTGTYIKDVLLTYDGQFNELYEDADTRILPVQVQERIIKQRVKVTKDILANADGFYDNNTNAIHEDWFTRFLGGLLGGGTTASKLDNFRFKVYLKHNLTQLYRDTDGDVIWQNRSGDDLQVDGSGVISDFKDPYPALVPDIYTKVLHETDPLHKDSANAVVANDSLYDYTNNVINEAQNGGYSAILETITQVMDDGTGTRTIQGYNYKKFFDALAVANNDKWKDGKPTYTSWDPIGNEANRTEVAIENAKASDMVRQFAITWYLDDEVAKLTRPVTGTTETEDADGNVTHADEVYELALHQAIVKANNYLKPFFSYDLDRIYAVEWDGSAQGGADRDTTTLSADTLFGEAEADSAGYYFGISEALPYGTYVIAEQQPRYTDLNDFANKHYEIDEPKEVTLPSVYESYEATQAQPEVLNSYYRYNVSDTPEELAAKYNIRFNEEAHVIRAHNADGDFEVYKHGLSVNHVRNGSQRAETGDYFALTQAEYKPYKDYYNAQDDRMIGTVPYYLSEGQSGREQVSKYYRYSSIAESAELADDVAFPGAAVTADNPNGIAYRDNVAAMSGIQTAYDGLFASMLVPWSVTEPDDEAADTGATGTGESTYEGFGYRKFHNRFYSAKLRIEKLDSETHENILHDGAIFNLYAASRNDTAGGNGNVQFYEEETIVHGSKEFLNAMGARNIQPWEREGTRFSGLVPAGTPIYLESEQILLTDEKGSLTGDFKSFVTIADESMPEPEGTAMENARQTVGYLETPKPLGAGVYVLAEVKPPVGYTRTKPVAIEIYSDKVAYYKEGNRDHRVVAATYEYPSDTPTANGNKPEDVQDVAGIQVENSPIKLTVEKLKESSAGSADTTADKTVTYKVSGRVEGSLAEIGNRPDYEYAYTEHGAYLGYAWKKGTLEHLAARQSAGERVELVFNGTIFAGYGYVTRLLETADDGNKYVAGATMTLFDAIPLIPSGDTEDLAYTGLTITRNDTGNIQRMYVEQGHAGSTVEFVQETEGGASVWTAKTVQRADTDILYYDLDSLDITTTKTVDGQSIIYGYDKNHGRIPLAQIESDKQNHDKTDTEHSIYAFKGGSPYLEFVGGDFTKIIYSAKDKSIMVGADTQIYHIDRDGNRDALVDPHTGMAYVTETYTDAAGRMQERTLVWSVRIAKDEHGNVIAKDKITTSRLATVGENQDGYFEDVVIDPDNPSGTPIPDEEKPSYTHAESGYITGSWESAADEESHHETTLQTNKTGQNMNDSVLIGDNNGRFAKQMNPVYDAFGLPRYYQWSTETYDKGTELYDRNGDFVRYRDSDQLPAYNRAAYQILSDRILYDGVPTMENQTQNALYHRQGENYVLENTWVTSDKTPNDPFHTLRTAGQPDILKRIPAGTYILEELRVPEGYLKGVPAGITVEETTAMHHAEMVDQTTKVEIPKVDGAQERINRLDMNTMDASGNPVVLGTTTEGKGTYSYGNVPGAVLALYAAEKVYTADGYYLRRDPGAAPVEFESTENMAGALATITAEWTTGTVPIYVEGLPEGYYLLEERSTPSGFVTSPPVEVYVTNTKEVQIFPMHDDHTKVEVEKYVQEGGTRSILQGAGFTLFDAVLDTQGNVIYENGVPKYHSDRILDTWESNDATDFTESINLKDYPNTSGQNEMTGFTKEFESMYRQNGTTPGSGVQWHVKRTAVRTSASDHIWKLEDGSQVSVTDGIITYPDEMDTENRDGFEAAFRDNTGNRDEIQWAVRQSAEYISHEQIDSSMATDGGGSTNFPSSATLHYRTADGMNIRITAYQPTADRQGRTFTFEYQFDYKKLDAVNNSACSYLTPEGRRRFDYLPTGNKYVLVETKVPDGFAKAEDSVIGVEDIPDVQYYDIENEISAIRISKVSGTGTKELAGAKLGFYRADPTDEFTKNDEFLVTSWITGSDGTYSEVDYINGRIPEGYVQGDLRPHTISRLADGVYYLAELTAPDYYTMFDPIRIEYRQEDEIRIVRAGNVLAEGALVIEKVDPEGTALLGAVFEVKAYRKNGEVAFETNASASTGSVTLEHLPLGELGADGIVKPYLYKVRELISPDGYAVNTLLETFSFAPNQSGASYAPGEAAVIRLQVKNEPTRLYIEKRDFDKLEDTGSDGIFIAGAVLAVYEVHGKDADDNYIYSDADLFTTWTTQEGSRHLIEGLVAGKSYLLKELQAPAGYNLMEPVIFTVSADGRKISRLTNDLNTISVNYIQVSDQEMDTDNRDMDSIQSVMISGRYVSKTVMEMTDRDGVEVARWISTGAGQTLTPTSEIVDGDVYTFTERTHYSDGSAMVTGKTTRRIHFNEQGLYHVTDRAAEKVTLALRKAQDGSLIRNYNPSEFFTEETIQNNVNPENPNVTMKNREAVAGEAINPNQAVFNSIFYVNTSNITTDIKVTARIDAAVQVIDAYEGVIQGDHITWVIENVAPLHGGYVSFATEITDRNAHETRVEATLTFNGKTLTSTKETPILQPNQLTIVNELTGSGKEVYADEESTFKVRLYNSAGAELKGSYRYTGSRAGELRSGDEITLSGNEFITIDPGNIYKNIRYRVKHIPDGKIVTERNSDGTVPEAFGASYVATRSLSDTKDRELFKKGERYILLETTEYTDHEVVESNKINFTLNEQAGIDGVGGYDKQTKVQIEKVDYDTGNPVIGSTMQILNLSGTLLEEWETTAAPHVLTGSLTPGETYLLREAKSPDGYGYAEDITFTVNQDGTVDTIIMEDRQTNVIVPKLDAESLNGLPGAVLAILDVTGAEVERWVSTGQPHVIKGRLVADAVYTLVEITPPDGFAPAEDITFTVSHDGAMKTIIMYDPPTDLLVKKLVATASDARPGEPLAGATLQILNEDKTPATASNASPDFELGEKLIFTSSNAFVRILRQLVAGKNYYLHEVLPAPGYAYAEDVPFTVGIDGAQNIVAMYDMPTKVVIEKQSRADGQGITGAVMQLLDATQTIVKEWVSTGEPVVFLGELLAGEPYILREIKAPEGYSHAEDITFTVSRDGSNDLVIMYDDQTTVSILKVDASSQKPLAGALLQIVDPVTAAIMDEWESTLEPHVIQGRLIANKSYLLREVKAPSGYSLQQDLEFKVPHGAETLLLTYHNRRPAPPDPGDDYIDFKKISTDGTPLSGAEFTFYHEDGSIYTTAASNSRGIISIVKPRDGTYTYRETKAPDGYLLNPNVYSFTVQYGAVITERLPILNHKTPEVVIEKIDAVTHETVGGAIIKIWDDLGWSIQETTGETGRFLFLAPHAGVFHMQEVTPPPGYQINSTVYDFTVHEDGSITGTTTIFNYPDGTPPPGSKIGKVMASYTSSLSGRGYNSFGVPGVRLPGALPKTGDDTPMTIYLILFAFSGLILAAVYRRKRKHEND